MAGVPPPLSGFPPKCVVLLRLAPALGSQQQPLPPTAASQLASANLRLTSSFALPPNPPHLLSSSRTQLLAALVVALHLPGFPLLIGCATAA